MKILFANKWLELVESGKWFFARRPAGTKNVIVVAVTDDEQLVMVEQHREAVGGNVIELPAGIVDPGEEVLVAARRELMEETGYSAEEVLLAGTFVTSPGITDEKAHVVIAMGIKQKGDGGGKLEEGESIVIHRIPVRDVFPWLDAHIAAGTHVSATIYSSIALMAWRTQSLLHSHLKMFGGSRT